MRKSYVLLAIASILGLGIYAAVVAADNRPGATTKPAKPCCPALSEAADHLKATGAAIDEAIILETGGFKDEKVLKALADAKRHLGEAEKALALPAKPAKIVNKTCPIMGGAVSENPGKGLTRMHKGQLVGFCCDGCPGAWDKLPDAEKDAKLEAALAPAKTLEKAKDMTEHGGH